MKAAKPTAKSVLTAITGRAYAGILNMTPAQRKRAQRALGGLTESNCAWHLFNMRQALALFIAASSPPQKPPRKRTPIEARPQRERNGESE